MYDALMAGNRDQAAAAMNTHMDSAAKRLTSLLQPGAIVDRVPGIR